MGAIHLAYRTSGLTQLGFDDALDAIDRAGYPGIELSFHRDRFNPFNLGADDLAGLREHLHNLRARAACVATASHFFDPCRPHEPSLMAIERAARKRRIDLIKRGIHIARELGVGLVTFGSGFLRDEHVANPGIDPRELLCDSIRECLREIRDDEDLTLLIEPEPGMYVETLADGLDLLRAIGSRKFKLHVDLCHAYCSEADYLSALAKAAPHARYLHISDARAGFNLKIVRALPGLALDPGRASFLVHFPDTADYLLVDRAHPTYFHDGAPTRARWAHIDELLARAGIQREVASVEYSSLYAGGSRLDDEIFTWVISQPGLSYDVLERARPIAAWLRGARNAPLVDRLLANTRTGIAHFHEIPGEGTLDFAASFRALAAHGFSGYGAIELYHHVDAWEHALTASLAHLNPLIAVRDAPERP